MPSLLGIAASAAVPSSTSPINNKFADAITITLDDTILTGTNVDATLEVGEPSTVEISLSTIDVSRSVWWKFTPDADYTIRLTTIGSDFDTVIAVYTGTAVNDLSLIAANDDQGIEATSEITFSAINGTDYHVAVYGFGLVGDNNFGTIDISALATTVYENTIIADSPVAFWPLRESSGGTAHDISGNYHDATYVSVGLASRDLGSSLGLVADFNGTDSQVNISPLPGSSTRSLEAWTIIDAIVGGSGLISEIFTGGGNNVQFEVGIDLIGMSSNQLTIGQYSPWRTSATEVTADTGLLTHVVATHDGSTMKLYVNGSLACFDAGNTIDTTDNGWVVGRRHDTSGTPFWNGAIGFVAIYDYVLSAGQVSAHYAAGIV